MTMDKGKGRAMEIDNPIQDGSTLPWVEKYRPSGLEDVVAHKDIISTLDRFISTNKVPHMLFYGPPGTGKTSTILACARKVYGPQFRNQVMELNASDDRGIDAVREQIKNFASTRQIFSSSFKMIILDEADAMTLAAQNALRRVIEKYTKNVRFCIICNYINKIAPAIQSRCTRFRFQPLPSLEIEKYVDHVINNERCNIDSEAKGALLKLSRGDMRKALNILQACHAAYEHIDESSIYNCVGHPHPSDIDYFIKSIMNEEFVTAYNAINSIKQQKGLALQDIITCIFEALDELQVPANTRIFILDQLASIEHRMSFGCSEKIQLSAMIASIKSGVDLAAKS
ncbi:DNA replication factor C complex subunit Rfc3 [Schizosaccharomyces cryophilus OY26]|uniref:Replication factor C subunit 3 n=1 Tax=Schizosaccharomyces cryophilus (strain OY26 / ATCC MYA-4695 / CBS 11777 / NBRC 106824 / NRRL Y48691) TaxID=653667 RepID=S9W092_SCHCR|nr:DNA replication factor C complex subunit Rfc3 [Schizosaccharomyces cryophilus OY26]EPY51475.1 DNA replication factor C complex subunit Rfc3 [Schizosaccharomyces cryophilus OY26]